MGSFYLEGCARGGGSDGDVDCWSSVGREIGEKCKDAGEWGAGLEKLVLGADFGGPFLISDW